MCFHQSDGIVKIEAVNVFFRQQCSQQIVLGAVEAGVDAPPIFPRLRHRNLWPKTLRYLKLFQSPLFLNFSDFFALPRCQNMLMVTLVVPAPPSPPGFRVSDVKQLDKQWLFPRIELAQLSGCHGSEKIWQINDEAVFSKVFSANTLPPCPTACEQLTAGAAR